VFSGPTELLDMLSSIKFGPTAIRFLSRLGFSREFLHWLEECQFKGSVIAMQEGEVVFPYEPCLRIEGTLIEAQLEETAVLNLKQ
jgi:nicotinate phosphoribosyltransferase